MVETPRGTCRKCGAEIFAGTDCCAACLLESGLDSLGETRGAKTRAGPVRADFGDYELLEEIGRGGQGIVYRAWQKSLNRIVALKVIALGHWATEAQAQRFRREAQLIASLEQPGIVPIYEIGERDGHGYFTMKFIDGEQLERVIKSARLSVRQAAKILAAVARTVQAAHERGVLHRDIKPGNILLDANGHALLTDFGLAKLVENENAITQTQDVLGTPSYIAPEQIRGAKELTRATDVYALGAVLFEMLTGRAPFLGGTKYETIRHVLENEPLRPRALNRKIDADLETICLKCLEKDPAHRYESARALAEDLERWLRNEPVQARRSGVVKRSRKLLQRNRSVAALAISLGLVALALALTIWKTRPQPTAESEAVALYKRAKNLFPTATNNNSGRQDLLEAADLLNQAVARDPSYFDAYSQLAATHDSLYLLGHDHTPARLALAEEALQHAISLRPDAGETHLARATHLSSVSLDYDGALAELERARQLLPNDCRVLELIARVQIRRGHAREALLAAQRAAELEPHQAYRLLMIAGCYWYMRSYAEALPLYDHALAIEPNNAQLKIFRADLMLAWKADTRAMHDVIAAVRTTNPDVIRQNADSWVLCTLADRDPVAARAALIAAGENTPLNQDAVHFNRSFVEGWIARLEKDEPRARPAFDAARAEQEKIVAAQPDYAPTLCVLGVIDAMLGRKAEALAECRRAAELLPIEKDALNAPLMTQWYAIAAAWLGEKDLAIEQLTKAVDLPGLVMYGSIKLLPFWDPLRGDPRFEKLLASLAPK